MLTKTADQLWQIALGELELQVTRTYFETWLKPTLGLNLTGSELTVGAPSTFHVEHLEKRMLPLIETTLRGVAKCPLSLKFQVYQRAAQQVVIKDLSKFQPLAEQAESSQTSSGLRPSLQGNGHHLNPKYTLDTFVVGHCNRLAHTVAEAVAEEPGTAYNPFYLYSGVGLGKTHLLHAVGNACLKKNLKVLYVTTEQFTNDFIKALRERKTEEFREKYRSVDVLLMDDIQFLVGKEETERGFFHTFNDLYNNNKQIVVASDRAPKALALVEERLRSRLDGGLKADIQPPDLETRVAIIETKAQQQKLCLDKGVKELLAARTHKNIRELEGLLNKVIAYARLTRVPVTEELISEALADSPEERHPIPSLQQIMKIVADYYHINPEAIQSKKRDKEIALARHIAMYLIRQETDLSLHVIGRELGGRDHSTVLHACSHISVLIERDPQVRYDVQALRDRLDLPVSA